jgi:glutathione synthase/RimK-type ligase-like ATP-grasp enzyme
MGLEPSWITPRGLFAISINGHEQYVNCARCPLNSHTSASLAKDKYLTRLILERHSMQNIPFASPRNQDEAKEFLYQHKEIIAKPLRGSGARDIHNIQNAAQLHALNITDYILEKYIAGTELRYLVLNSAVIGMYESDYGTSIEAGRALQCISFPECDWDPTLVASSIRIASILGLKFAAVDYLITDTGRPYILEVNTTPDLKWFHAPTSGPALDIARQFLEAIAKKSERLFSHSDTVPLETYSIEAYT